jgi:hypothetical protein
MNEQIRKLLNEATSGLEPDISPQRTVTLNEMEKFAELIIRDCMHDCLRMQLYVQYTPEELLFQTKYRKIIKEHFGVEE